MGAVTLGQGERPGSDPVVSSSKSRSFMQDEGRCTKRSDARGCSLRLGQPRVSPQCRAGSMY